MSAQKAAIKGRKHYASGLLYAHRKGHSCTIGCREGGRLCVRKALEGTRAPPGRRARPFLLRPAPNLMVLAELAHQPVPIACLPVDKLRAAVVDVPPETRGAASDAVRGLVRALRRRFSEGGARCHWGTSLRSFFNGQFSTSAIPLRSERPAPPIRTRVTALLSPTQA